LRLGKKPVLCIKIGGRALADSGCVAELATEIAELQASFRCIVVHGGGAEVTRISGRFGLAAEFREGIRMTSPAEMEVVDMVLAGSVNTALVRALGHLAVGLSGCDGATLTGERIAEDTHTGKVTGTDGRLLEELTASDWVPVVSSVSMDSNRTPLNINADEAALAISEALRADYLLFLSDIPGILEEGEVVHVMTPATTEDAIARGVISGGMIPKVRSSARALEAGVGTISIGSFEHHGDLAALIRGDRGSSIVQEDTKDE